MHAWCDAQKHTVSLLFAGIQYHRLIHMGLQGVHMQAHKRH